MSSVRLWRKLECAKKWREKLPVWNSCYTRTDRRTCWREEARFCNFRWYTRQCDARTFAFAQAPFWQPRISTVCTGRDLPFVRPRTGIRWMANAKFVVRAAEFMKIQLFWDVIFFDWGFPGHQSSDALLTPFLNSCPWRWRQYTPSKRWWLPASQKTSIFGICEVCHLASTVA
jgi:hypothetical protein